MSKWQKTRLDKCTHIVSGGTPKTSVKDYWDGDIFWVTPKDLSSLEVAYIDETPRKITNAGLNNSGAEILPKGSVLFSSRAPIGHVAINRVPMATNQGFKSFVPDTEKLDAKFLYYWLRKSRAYFNSLGNGATFKEVSKTIVGRVEIPLPPIAEQKRIAAILDKAEEIRSQRRQVLEQLDAIGQSIFLEMFGDPATNPKGWQTDTLGELTAKFSDGPFGSNLKTSHYSETGIRVIRLQNISVGELKDDDRAYIAPSHFKTLKKHECRPGDVLIATLGEPNLRACIQPDWLSIAVNKADCVQARPKPGVTNAEYLCALLNQPSTERMAHDLILGETRLRISMGRLRTLRVPTPPIALQQEFARRIEAIAKLKASHRESLAQLDALFASLQHRAFRGEL